MEFLSIGSAGKISFMRPTEWSKQLCQSLHARFRVQVDPTSRQKKYIPLSIEFERVCCEIIKYNRRKRDSQHNHTYQIMLHLQDSSEHSCMSVMYRKQPASTPLRPRSSVSFSKDEVEIHAVDLRCSLSDEEKIATWYNKEDYRRMKREYAGTVKKIAKSLPFEPDEEPRGLEQRTPRAGKKRLKTIYMVMDAVLETQERQFEDDKRDPDYLAEIYRQASAHCLAAAYATAQSDASFVEEHVRNNVSSEEGLQADDSAEWDQISLEDDISEANVSMSSGHACADLSKLRSPSALSVGA